MVYTQALTKRLVPPVSWRLGNYVLAPSSANVERYMWLGCLAAKPTEFSRTKLPLHTLSAVTQIAASRAICFILLVEKEDLPSEVEIDQQKIDLVAFCTFLAQCNSSGQARLIKSIMLDQTGALPATQTLCLAGAKSQYQSLLANQGSHNKDRREPFPAMTLLVNISHPDFNCLVNLPSA